MHHGTLCTIEQLDPPAFPGPVQIALKGEIDTSTAAEVMLRVSTLIGSARDVVIDIADVTFLGASALSLLVRLRESRRDLGGDLTVRGARPHIRSVISRVRLDDLLEPASDGHGRVCR